jgi:branched-chain amino acid transport system substrate-binding protein
MKKARSWKLLLPLVALAAVAAVWVSGSSAAPQTHTIRVAIMTDCKGGFGFGYELDIGGAQAAFAQYAGGKVTNKNKPSAGMTGIKVGTHKIQIVGYGCGDDTAPTALKETRRLMEQLKADVMVGPLSGDEAVTVANYAKAHPKKTFVIGTAGSQDPTMQIAPKNVFRYHGDGAQWNAGLGEIVYKKLKWRRAAIIMDDYSFGWTSAAGIIADFCAIGGQITKRVFPPLNTTDYSAFVRQLPRPNTVDGYFWVVGGTGTASSLKAFEQAYGKLDPKQHAGNLFFAFLGADKVVAPKVLGSYVGGFGTGPGLKTARAKAYEAIMKKWYPKLPAADGFVYNYYNAAWALVRALKANGGQVGAALQRAMPKTNVSAYEVSGVVALDSRRQAIQDQYPLQIIRNPDGSYGTKIVGYVPNVDQSFGGLFKPTSPPPGRSQPKCVKKTLPWQGKIREVRNGVVTNTVIK